jgi:Zn-dependent peptidase ImmA (M78 family)
MPPAPPYKTRTGGIIVPPRSKDNIASNAGIMRKFLRLENKQYFPVVEVYETLDLLYKEARFEVLEMHEMGGDHGRTYPDRNLIYIREDVYERACAGEARDRFTMCHELGHLMMHRGVALSRIDPENPPKIYRNSEWQADTFASHLMMPKDLIATCTSLDIAMTTFGTSQEAVWARMGDMKKT